MTGIQHFARLLILIDRYIFFSTSVCACQFFVLFHFPFFGQNLSGFHKIDRLFHILEWKGLASSILHYSCNLPGEGKAWGHGGGRSQWVTPSHLNTSSPSFFDCTVQPVGGGLPCSISKTSLIAGHCLQWVINKTAFVWAVLTLGPEGTDF